MTNVRVRTTKRVSTLIFLALIFLCLASHSRKNTRRLVYTHIPDRQRSRRHARMYAELNGYENVYSRTGIRSRVSFAPSSLLSAPPGAQFVASQYFKLLFCFIPKNGCTKLKMLFLKVVASEFASASFDDVHKHFGSVQTLRPLLLPEDVRRSILTDDGWVRAVILRDPIDRFLSAYLDKIAGREDVSFFHLRNKRFYATAGSLYEFLGHSATWGWEHHFKLQSQLCGFQNSWGWWDRILVYDASKNMTKSTAGMFDHRIDYIINSGWRGQGAIWDDWTSHRTSGYTVKETLVAEICSNFTVYRALLDYTQPDYDFFDFFHPNLCTSRS